jgi:chromosome partitioning protein
MVFSVTSLKGGIGKTTIAQNMAVCFAHAGKRVCLIDTDFEIQSTSDWGKDRGDDVPPIHVELVTQDNIVERVLALKKEYDVVVIDGAPALFELSSRAILLSDVVLIPALPSIEEVRALERFMVRFNQSKMMKENLGGTVQAFVVLNKYNDNLRIDREVKRVLEKFGLPLLETKLSYRVAYREAKIEGKGVLEYLDKKAKEEISALFDEITNIAVNA